MSGRRKKGDFRSPAKFGVKESYHPIAKMAKAKDRKEGRKALPSFFSTARLLPPFDLKHSEEKRQQDSRRDGAVENEKYIKIFHLTALFTVFSPKFK